MDGDSHRRSTLVLAGPAALCVSDLLASSLTGDRPKKAAAECCLSRTAALCKEELGIYQLSI